MANVKQTTKTRTVAGHRITLVVGRTYVATRPMASKRDQVFDVTIRRDGAEFTLGYNDAGEYQVKGLSYDAANKLINAFNNGACCRDGRVW